MKISDIINSVVKQRTRKRGIDILNEAFDDYDKHMKYKWDTLDKILKKHNKILKKHNKILKEYDIKKHNIQVKDMNNTIEKINNTIEKIKEDEG